MFPITITLHTSAQLNAVMAALDPTLSAAPKAVSAVSGPVTAKASAAQEKTANAPSPAAASAATAQPASTVATTESPNGSTSSVKPSESAAPAVSFEVLKKAFLSLATKEGGRAKCEGVLKPLGLAKLSEAKDAQYAELLAAIEKASA